LTIALPTPDGGFPWTILAINVAGSGLLGILLEVVVERAPAQDRAAWALRLLLGVGFIGALTTYSTLALDVDLALRRGWTTPVCDAALTLAGGLLACAAGIAAGRRLPVPVGWRQAGDREDAREEAS
ncbi:MAG TPA: CrcB family protein, partial [Candidatus Dormibacteraeota bacterium]|nr:CrcB family protein [Candidatus Dormibacteraeota bacterium]